MTAILRNESRKLYRGSLLLVIVFGLLSALYFSVFTSFAADAEQLMEAFPEAMFEFFGIARLHTIEGFIAAELYSFFWVLLLGMYFAYVGGRTIAGDVESRRMDLTLSNPVSRESVLVQKVAALWVPLVVLNVAVPLMVYAGSVLIDYPINPVAIVMVHALGIPYLLVCAGIGVLLSVGIDRARTAQATAIGIVFMQWMVEGASNMDPDYEWIGYAMPSRYYAESDILVHEEYAFFDAGILVLGFLLLILIAGWIFTARDI